MTKRKNLDYLIRNKIKEIFNNRCAKCGSRGGCEIHHILPVYNGGKDNIDNLILLCCECHRHAPDNIHDFVKFMASPYSPKMEVALTVSRGLCKVIFDLSEEEFRQYKNEGGDAFFDRKILPMFKGLITLINGYSEED